MVIRSFLPVGQGAFYCEQFYEDDHKDRRVNVVYDCGSSTNVKLVETQIANMFYEGEHIQALFISHLHDDHINGIPFLLRYCQVEEIFFPLITPKNAIYIKLYNMMANETDSFSSSFAENPVSAIEELHLEYSPRLIQISEDRQDHDSKSNSEIFDSAIHDLPIIDSGKDVSSEIFDQEMRVKNSDCGKWIFIPFNFTQVGRVKKLQETLNSASYFGRNMNNADLTNIWKNGSDQDREKIMAAYKAVRGSLNTNSTTLYSGINLSDYNLHICKSLCINNYLRCKCDYDGWQVGCLYMGDYDASGKNKWKKLYESYKEYWKSIGCVQIPHHGSYHNYNKKLATLNAWCIISVGTQNMYRHPSSSVINDLLFNGRCLHLVTEKAKSEMHFCIYI